MKCIVIDDEPFALKLIEGYVERTPFLEMLGGFNNPFEALRFIELQSPDLVFLDINMPELSGIQLLKSLRKPQNVIFTTAYPEFGAESYEYNAIDYLLKPITYDRFLKAVNKAEGQLNSSLQEHTQLVQVESTETVFVKSGTKIHKLQTQSIQYIEAAGNYMTFYFEGGKLLSLLSMSDVLNILPPKQFMRIHKSYIVSIRHINIIEKHQVVINGKRIPIGVTYRPKFQKMLGNHPL